MIIYEEDIKEFFFDNLIKVGCVTTDADLTIIADIVFDYLVHIEVLDDVEYNEEDEE